MWLLIQSCSERGLPEHPASSDNSCLPYTLAPRPPTRKKNILNPDIQHLLYFAAVQVLLVVERGPLKAPKMLLSSLVVNAAFKNAQDALLSPTAPCSSSRCHLLCPFLYSCETDHQAALINICLAFDIGKCRNCSTCQSAKPRTLASPSGVKDTNDRTYSRV